MSEYRRNLIYQSKAEEASYDGMAEVKDMSNWVDNESWSYADTTSKVISWSGRCCYPKYIKLDPTKKYKIYFPTTNASGWSRFLNADKTIIRTVLGTSVIDAGTSYIVAFSTDPLAKTKSMWGNGNVYILQI